MGKYKINNQVFSSKEKITEKIRSLERKYDDYETIGDADKKFLIEIFRYHPNFEDKMDGMTDLVFAESVHYNGRTRCIFVAYGDTNEDIQDRPMDDISWVECIKNIPVPTKHKIHFKFTFGKYKGKTIEAVNEIDRAYLHWVTNSEFKNRSVKIKVGQFLKYNYILPCQFCRFFDNKALTYNSHLLLFLKKYNNHQFDFAKSLALRNKCIAHPDKQN
jgi:hypothetical protein